MAKSKLGRVAVYFTPDAGRPRWTVAWVGADGRRRRGTHATEIDARAAAERIETRIVAVGLAAAEMTAADCASWARAVQLLPGVPLEVAAAEYAAARQALGNVPLAAAVSFYVSRHGVSSASVSAIVCECLAAKAAAGLSVVHVSDLRSRLGRFAAAFAGPLSSVTGERVADWLASLRVNGTPLAPRTRNNYRLAVQTLVTWARGRRYLPRDWDEMAAVPVARDLTGAPAVFTPAELSVLLAACPRALLPFLSFGAFAGMRTAEILRLDWSRVRWASGVVVIEGNTSKTGQRRLAPILPALRAWCEPLVMPTGPVCRVGNVGNALGCLGRAIGGWRVNALRHSWISYRVAELQDVARVALEAGNSPRVIFSSYRELVTPAEAAEWFALRPDRPANVVDLSPGRHPGDAGNGSNPVQPAVADFLGGGGSGGARTR